MSGKFKLVIYIYLLSLSYILLTSQNIHLTVSSQRIEIIDIPNIHQSFFNVIELRWLIFHNIHQSFENLIKLRWLIFPNHSHCICSPIIPPRSKNLLEVPKALAAHIDHHQPAICNSLSLYSFPKNNWNIDRVLNFPVFEPFLKRNPVKLKCLKL